MRFCPPVNSILLRLSARRNVIPRVTKASWVNESWVEGTLLDDESKSFPLAAQHYSTWRTDIGFVEFLLSG